MKHNFLILLLLCFVSCQKDFEQFNLNISVNPDVAGSVSPMTQNFNEGETVSLTAVAAAGYYLLWWPQSFVSHPWWRR